MRRAYRHADACGRFEAVEDRGQEGATAGFSLQGKSPCGGHDNTTRMDHRHPMQIVRFQNVAQRAHQKGQPLGLGRYVRGGRCPPPIEQNAARAGIPAREAVGDRIEREKGGRIEIGFCDGLFADQADKRSGQGTWFGGRRRQLVHGGGSR